MMGKDEKIIQDWEMIDNAYIDEVCRLLRLHETNIQEYMVDCVASICDVDKLDMMTNVSNLNTIHSRWLFWYAYRYMTKDSFSHISHITLRYGKKFTEQSVSSSVNKMGNMIDNDTIWAKRWAIIKRIIKLRDSTLSDENQNAVVIVQYPKNVEIKLRTKTK
jgi:hypothetical protein